MSALAEAAANIAAGLSSHVPVHTLRRIGSVVVCAMALLFYSMRSAAAL